MTQPAAIDRDFIDLVGRDIRGHASVTSSEKEWIHSDEQIERRHAALIALKKDVEVQLATQKARWCHKQVELQGEGDDGTKWLNYRSSEQDWRARAIKFLMAIEDEISAVKEVRRDMRRATESDDDVLYLRDLIARHREETDTQDMIPSEADRDLWAILEV